jgi:DNA-binding CsgD family transcriptional regulator
VDLPVQRVRAALEVVDAADTATVAADLPAALLPSLVEAFGADVVAWTTVEGTGSAEPAVGVVARSSGERVLSLRLDGGAGTGARVVLTRSGTGFDDADVQLLEALRPLLSRRLTVLLRLGAARQVLSSREREVLDLVATGLTDAAIAHRLGCRPRTVDKHLEHAYRALGVGNRAAAVARWVQEGEPRR